MQRISELFDRTDNNVPPATRTIGLLASVRCLTEARLAVKHRVDIVDIKEPGNGALGRADESTIRNILTEIPDSVSISVAMGELNDAHDQEVFDFLESVDPNSKISYAKFGLAAMRNDSQWIHKWRQVCRRLPSHVAPVAVAYVDVENARSPSIEAVIEAGQHLHCRAVLLDTFKKEHGDTFHYVSDEQLCAHRNDANLRGMKLVLAGSIDQTSFEKLTYIQPQLIGVRGALCLQKKRTAEMDEQTLVQFVTALKRIHCGHSHS